MRSVVCLKPGETRGCVGCHEGRNQAPPPARVARRPPAAEPARAAALGHEDGELPPRRAAAGQCPLRRLPRLHRETNKVILTDDLTDQFTIAYQELLPYLNGRLQPLGSAGRRLPRPPYTYGSGSRRW